MELPSSAAADGRARGSPAFLRMRLILPYTFFTLSLFSSLEREVSSKPNRDLNNCQQKIILSPTLEKTFIENFCGICAIYKIHAIHWSFYGDFAATFVAADSPVRGGAGCGLRGLARKLPHSRRSPRRDPTGGATSPHPTPDMPPSLQLRVSSSVADIVRVI